MTEADFDFDTLSELFQPQDEIPISKFRPADIAQEQRKGSNGRKVSKKTSKRQKLLNAEDNPLLNCARCEKVMLRPVLVNGTGYCAKCMLREAVDNPEMFQDTHFERFVRLNEQCKSQRDSEKALWADPYEPGLQDITLVTDLLNLWRLGQEYKQPVVQVTGLTHITTDDIANDCFAGVYCTTAKATMNPDTVITFKDLSQLYAFPQDSHDATRLHN